MQVTIIYGSTGGATGDAAQLIADRLSCETKLVDIADGSKEDFEGSHLILGTSTWGDGDLQDDWDDFFDTLDEIDFSGKTVALFGIGDQDSYYDTFVDGMGILYEKAKEKGATIIGDGVDASSFDFGESRSIVDGSFVGLVLDEDNQDELSEERIKEWTKKIDSLLT